MGKWKAKLLKILKKLKMTQKRVLTVKILKTQAKILKRSKNEFENASKLLEMARKSLKACVT